MSGESVFGAATTEPREKEETKTRLLPPYHVILENDDYHSMQFVMDVIQKALGTPKRKRFNSCRS